MIIEPECYRRLSRVDAARAESRKFRPIPSVKCQEILRTRRPAKGGKCTQARRSFGSPLS